MYTSVYFVPLKSALVESTGLDRNPGGGTLVAEGSGLPHGPETGGGLTCRGPTGKTVSLPGLLPLDDDDDDGGVFFFFLCWLFGTLPFMLLRGTAAWPAGFVDVMGVGSESKRDGKERGDT